MQIQVQQVPVKGLVEWLSVEVGQIGQTQGNLAGHCYQVIKPSNVGPPWSNQNYSIVWIVLQLLHHFAQDGNWWEGIWAHIFLGQTECIHCPGLGVWNQ